MTAITTPSIFQTLGINEKTEVTTSDVIDVFVARQEQHVHDLLDQAQQRLALYKQNFETLKQDIRMELSRGILRSFVSMDNNHVSIDYTHDANKIEFVLDKPNQKSAWVNITIKHTVRPGVGITFKEVGYGHKEPKPQIANEIRLELDLSGVMCIELDSCMELIENCQKDILTINTEMKSMGRKVRQLRGAIAERKLQANGIEDFTNDPAIASMITTPKLLTA